MVVFGARGSSTVICHLTQRPDSIQKLKAVNK